jgi:hypothetical protein
MCKVFKPSFNIIFGLYLEGKLGNIVDHYINMHMREIE